MTNPLVNLHQARRRGAFTLIEILVVVVILIIIVALIVSVGSYIRNSAVEKKTRSLEQILMTAVQAYYANQHAYPMEARNTNAPAEDLAVLHDIPANTNSELDALFRSENLFYRLNNVPAAKAKLAALPADAIATDFAARVFDARGTSDGNKQIAPYGQYFCDSNGVPLDYQTNGGLGGGPVIISAGKDKYHSKGDSANDDKYLSYEDDNIRSDR
jgi:type II secretory pathway pseudopilin PulG